MAEHWTNLPMDLLIVIVRQFDYMDDFIIFSCICKPWRVATDVFKNKPLTLPPKSPWLMLAEEHQDVVAEDECKSDEISPTPTRRFFSLSTGKTHKFELPEASGRLILGANFGWLMTLGEDLQVNLLHPFLRHQISLPPMLTLPIQYDYSETFKPEDCFDMFVQKIAVSWASSNGINNNSSPCTIMVIYGACSMLAFTKLGDKVWSNVQVPSKSFQDVTYYKGRFYAVDCHGVIFVCDLDDNKFGARATQIALAPVGDKDWFQKYLVESCGDLLLVSRVLLYNPGDEEVDDNDENDIYRDLERNLQYDYSTISFSVWKLKEEEECGGSEGKYGFKLCEVKNLENKAVFVGRNTSVSLVGAEDKDVIKGNCIYFTDDHFESFNREEDKKGGHDMGIFNMEDGTIQPHYQGISLHSVSPPVWYL